MGKLGFLFPGQGSQYVGMGKDFVKNFSVAEDILKKADDALGFSLSVLCFEGPLSTLTLTENAQPAILTASYAAYRVLEEELKLLPDFTAGHSMGEYTALVVSGVMKFEDAVKIVRLRGKFMQEAVPPGLGGMAAILGVKREKVEKICKSIGKDGVVTPANINGPEQIVISGEKGLVAAVEKEIQRLGGKGIPLSVSAPFHCSLMDSAGEKLEKELSNINLNNFTFPVIANVDACINNSEEKVKRLLVKQVQSPVLWEDSMNRMIYEGVDQVIEIGPGRVLTGLMRRINRDVKTYNCSNVSDLNKLKVIFKKV
ncbi:MAG: ACP S-malonyltransferase [Thermodesulfobacteriota bacterium]|nr:ACP S-malonyltransferase [Thermodesulfobacteriota bacterium]